MRLAAALASLLAAGLPPQGHAEDLPRRPFLGVTLTVNNEAARQRYGVAETGGIVVMEVHAGSSAEAAGLQVADVILAADGAPLESPGELIRMLHERRTGDVVDLALIRGGERLRQRLELKEFPRERYDGAAVEYGTVARGEDRLRSILTLPAGRSAPSPVLFIIQGIDCSSIEQTFDPDGDYARFVRQMTALGVATLRVEKGGVGDSQGEACAESDFRTEADGFLAALRQLKRDPRVDRDRVYLFGLSMGGVWGPMIAAQEPVSGVIVYGTIGRPFLEYLLENHRRQERLAAAPFGELEEKLKLEEELLHLLLVEKQTPADVLAQHPNLATSLSGILADAGEQPPRHLFAGRTYQFLRQIQELNLSASWEKVEGPVLVIWGRGDYVSARADHELIAAIVNARSPGRAQLVEVDADHWMGVARSQEEAFRNRHQSPRPTIPFSTEVQSVVEHWLRAEGVG